MGWNPTGGGGNPFAGRGSLGSNDVLGNALDKANPYKGGKSLSGGGWEDALSGADPSNPGSQKQKDYSAEIAAENTANQGVLGQMTGAENAYTAAQTAALKARQGAADTYTTSYYNDLKDLQNQVQDQAQNAKSTYTNTILPRYQDLMERSANNARGEMTLGEVGDPNNAVATGVRNLYNTEGQSEQNLFENEAQGYNRMGQANYGVLAALGSQATAGQLGQGMPMTGAQLQAIQGANLGQAGQAFANTQAQVNNLRQQGLATNVGMRQAGVGAGMQQANTVYGMGQQAQQQAAQDVSNYQNAYGQNMGLQDYYNQRVGGLQGQQFGTLMGQAEGDFATQSAINQMPLGFAEQQGAREMAQNNAYYGAQMGQTGSQIQAQGGALAGGLGALGTIGGGIAGGYFSGGNPAAIVGGAAAGGAVGGGIGKAINPGVNPQTGQAAQGYQGTAYPTISYNQPPAQQQPQSPYAPQNPYNGPAYSNYPQGQQYA